MAIVHTVGSKGTEQGGGTIRETVARIERDTGQKALGRWLEAYPGAEQVGLFVAKVDVSEIPMAELQAALPAFEAQLLGLGFGLYSIDYTQDFSGVLDRPAAVAHLCAHRGFREQGDLAEAMRGGAATILANTDSVGRHVLTWVATNARGHTVRSKLYNKVVSNFEAGEIRAPVGGHLADFVDCPNAHLRKTFQHPDAQARGLCRIEVSLYACRGSDLSAGTAEAVVGEALALVSTDDAAGGLFVVQPPRAQWANLAAVLDRCLVVADRTQGAVFVGWYAHTGTGRVSGVHVVPTTAKAASDESWERAVVWAAADFGFRACPIFRVDILAATEDGVELGPLRCYTKDAGAASVLAASKRPTQLHPDGPDIAAQLPPTATVSWVWRTQKSHAVGVEVSPYPLQEVPEIAAGRTISALSTRGRERRLRELQDAESAEEWKRAALGWLEAERQRRAAQQQKRAEELAMLARLVAAHVLLESSKKKTHDTVEQTLRGPTTKPAELPPGGPWRVLGYRSNDHTTAAGGSTKARVVLQSEGGDPLAMWATAGLERILGGCSEFFEVEADKFHRKLYWLPAVGKRALGGLEIAVGPVASFRGREGRPVYWSPVRVVSAPDPGRVALLQRLADAEHQHQVLSERQAETELAQAAGLRVATAPPATKTGHCSDLPPGEYLCARYAVATFRGAARFVLFLVPSENGERSTDEEERPTTGHFLEAAVVAHGGAEGLAKARGPLLCRLGDLRTTPNKKKARLATFAQA